MIPPFDIFKIDPYGDRGCAAGRGHAREARIISEISGTQRFFTVEENGEVSEGVD